MFKIDRKLSLIDLVLGIAWFYALSMLLIQYVDNNRKDSYIQWIEKDNYRKVAISLLEYNSKYKTFPESKNWYDALVEEYVYISDYNFRGYASKQGYCVALNKNLAENQEYGNDTALIFSSFGSKNLYGDKETLEKHIKNQSKGWIITIDGTFLTYNKNTNMFICNDEKKKIPIEDVKF